MKKKFLVLAILVCILLGIEFALYVYLRVDKEVLDFIDNVTQVVKVDYEDVNYDTLNELYDTYATFTDRQKALSQGSMQELAQYRVELDNWCIKQDERYNKILEENRKKIEKYSNIELDGEDLIRVKG